MPPNLLSLRPPDCRLLNWAIRRSCSKTTRLREHFRRPMNQVSVPPGLCWQTPAAAPATCPLKPRRAGVSADTPRATRLPRAWPSAGTIRRSGVRLQSPLREPCGGAAGSTRQGKFTRIRAGSRGFACHGGLWLHCARAWHGLPTGRRGSRALHECALNRGCGFTAPDGIGVQQIDRERTGRRSRKRSLRSRPSRDGGPTPYRRRRTDCRGRTSCG